MSWTKIGFSGKETYRNLPFFSQWTETSLLCLKVIAVPPPAPVRPAQDEPQRAAAPLAQHGRPQVRHEGRRLPRRHQEGRALHLPGQHGQVHKCNSSKNNSIFHSSPESVQQIYHLVDSNRSVTRFNYRCYAVFFQTFIRRRQRTLLQPGLTKCSSAVENGLKVALDLKPKQDV